MVIWVSLLIKTFRHASNSCKLNITNYFMLKIALMYRSDGVDLIQFFPAIRGGIKRRLTSWLERTDKDSQSFYVTNFPEYADIASLWKAFDGFGCLINVYIAKKRAKTGKRFAFVRFMGVKHVLAMENMLANVWIGSFHLFVEASKFDCKEKKANVQVDSSSKGSKKVNPNIDASECSTLVVNKVDSGVNVGSYASKVSGLSAVKKVVLTHDELTSVQNNDHVIMAKVGEVGTLYTIYQICLAEGFKDFKIQYVGGYWIWLKFDTESNLAAFKANANIMPLFSCVKDASDEFIVDERIVWIEITGLPMCAWGTNAFKKVASAFGRFLFFEANIKVPISSGRVCIATYDNNPISTSCIVEISGKDVVA
ncbi:uncharacterized protein [Rutidosis leptorrhynchoides]|uniref:uncharacterized protein n=1 Tax=Rutidosis leptorrhynchoides TaxID=125765 RepID=UPI003A98F427